MISTSHVLRKAYERTYLASYITRIHIGALSGGSFESPSENLAVSETDSLMDLQRSILESLEREFGLEKYLIQNLCHMFADSLKMVNITCAILLLPNLAKIVLWPSLFNTYIIELFIGLLRAVALTTHRYRWRQKVPLLAKLEEVELHGDLSMTLEYFRHYADSMYSLPSLRVFVVAGWLRTWVMQKDGRYQFKSWSDGEYVGKPGGGTLREAVNSMVSCRSF